ncbi:MAG TPA: hypothetical protein VIY71_09120 [Solirubrobacterales bacterium]
MKKAWEWLRDELASYGDTDVAIALGLLIGLLSALEVTGTATTSGLILLVLAAVAASLHRDRTLRKKLEKAVGELEGRLDDVSRAFSSPLPYEVISGHYQWNFLPGGKIATVCKRARVRFVHNGVWSILQWHSKGVDVREINARRLFEQGSSLDLKVFGDLRVQPRERIGKLIALDAECRQNDIVELEYSFNSHGNFPEDRESIVITVETATATLLVELLWAEDRRPEDVEVEVDGRRDELEVKRDGGRAKTTAKLSNLTRGQEVAIEWRWVSLHALLHSNHEESQ